jgi:structural maintenance of chromosome 3 (chondroitin sulfate proteoglycan 6)
MLVLSNKYTHISAEEKKRLLYEGPSPDGAPPSILSVELLLDNSKGKMPIEKDSISIRRTFNPATGKDTFSINGKQLSKLDFHQLLESSGFSFKNPYYFIQQGGITKILNYNQVAFFTFISEVAGTKVYETKRKESLEGLEEIKNKIQKLTYLLSKVDVHLRKLGKDASQFKKYKEKEGQKKQ